MNFKHHCLVGAIVNPRVNPGDMLILRGIEYLVSQAELEIGNAPLFSRANIFDDPKSAADNLTWELLKERVSSVIFCGTPQLNKDGCGAHFLNLCKRSEDVRKLGIKSFYFWLGSGYTNHLYTEQSSVDAMYSANVGNLGRVRDNFDAIITRDSITHKVLNRAGIFNAQFLDCVFFTPDYFRVSPGCRNYNLMVLRGKDNLPELEKFAKKSLELERVMDDAVPTLFMVHEEREFSIWKNWLPRERLICVCSPADLLRVYAGANQVVSFRVHGSVVALSLGKSVVNVSTDSRSNILEAAGFESVRYPNYLELKEFQFRNLENVKELKEINRVRFIEFWKNLWVK